MPNQSNNTLVLPLTADSRWHTRQPLFRFSPKDFYSFSGTAIKSCTACVLLFCICIWMQMHTCNTVLSSYFSYSSSSIDFVANLTEIFPHFKQFAPIFSPKWLINQQTKHIYINMFKQVCAQWFEKTCRQIKKRTHSPPRSLSINTLSSVMAVRAITLASPLVHWFMVGLDWTDLALGLKQYK